MDIEKQISLLQERNKRVELDKAWEISFTRRSIITLFTYGVSVTWLTIIGVDSPWLTALVPALGYILSTFSLPVVKAWWIKTNPSVEKHVG